MWTLARSDLLYGLWHGVSMAMAVLAVLGPQRLEPAEMRLPVMPVVLRHADFGNERASTDTHNVVDWVIDTHDNQGSAFVVIDKRAAKLYVFDESARLRGSTVILLGAARRDDTVAGIGQRPIAAVQPQERTTPAGRFLAERGHNGRGEDVVWVDYEAGVSMHRVLTTHPAERRLARLASPSIADNRISYGCINIPVAFYESQIRPMFARHRAPVYVLPETKPVEQVFAMSNLAQR